MDDNAPSPMEQRITNWCRSWKSRLLRMLLAWLGFTVVLLLVGRTIEPATTQGVVMGWVIRGAILVLGLLLPATIAAFMFSNETPEA